MWYAAYYNISIVLVFCCILQFIIMCTKWYNVNCRHNNEYNVNEICVMNSYL